MATIANKTAAPSEPGRPGRPRHFSDSEEARLVRVYLDGGTLAEIRREFGVSFTTVYSILNRHGVARGRMARGNGPVETTPTGPGGSGPDCSGLRPNDVTSAEVQP